MLSTNRLFADRFVVVSVELSNSAFKSVGEDVWLDIVVVWRDFSLTIISLLWSALSGRATRAVEGEGLWVMLVTLVSKGDKGVNYYITTLWSYSVSMLHAMDGGRASPLYRHPVREAVEGYTVNRVYRISRIGLYRVYRFYRVHLIRLQRR